jgi:hypothetical protein
MKLRWAAGGRIAIAISILMAVGPAAVLRPATVTAADPSATPASDVRIALGRLLGEHAFLLMSEMRATAEETPDATALRTALDANTEALRDAIASVYGDDAGASFQPIWQRHIDASAEWATAAKSGDTAASTAALQELSRFRSEFSDFLTGANPEISADAEVHAVQLHLDQLKAVLDKDYQQAFATQRAAYSHMFEFGDDIARAIVAQFPERFPDGAVAFSPKTTLRLTLGRLLGEHLVLAAAAMRTGLVQGADAGAAVQSLDENSADLAEAVGRIFGADAQAAFAELWGKHIETYIAYIEAVRTGDAAGRQSALESLHGYHAALAEFLHSAIPSLSQADLEALISHHVSALISQVDAAAAGDFVRAITVTREAYGHMFVVGDALGTGIAAEFPDRFGDVGQIPPTNAAPETTVRFSCAVASGRSGRHSVFATGR